jgi:5-methylcytosine-specific restriction endonuclease McrA
MFKGGDSLPQGEAAHNKCRKTLPKQIVSHGDGGYSRGCRCDICRAAKSKQMSRYMERHKAMAGEAYSTTWRRAFRDKHGFWPSAAGSDWIKPLERRAVYERDNWTCQICGEPVDITAHFNSDRYPSLDHIIPRSAQLIPDHSPTNLRTACRLCNSKRGAAVA